MGAGHISLLKWEMSCFTHGQYGHLSQLLGTLGFLVPSQEP